MLRRGCPDLCRWHAALRRVLNPRAVRKHPPRCDRSHHPRACHARRVDPACVLPLPTETFERAEARCDRPAPPGPEHAHLLRGTIGQHHPGLRMRGAPHDDQRSGASHGLMLQPPTPDPRMARSWHELVGALAAGTRGRNGRLVAHAQDRMPAAIPKALPSAGTPHAAIGQHHPRWGGTAGCSSRRRRRCPLCEGVGG